MAGQKQDFVQESCFLGKICGLKIEVKKKKLKNSVNYTHNNGWFPLSTMLIHGQKVCFLGPNIFEITQPNWHQIR